MIDPTTQLAFSVCSNKGVYALLLGSGISSAAGIPTGWEITLDLVRKLAAAEGAGSDCDPDPAAWYRGRYGKEPDYSDILNTLGPTPHERQALLRAYFEPSEEDKENGLKVPTEAHRAIARLVASGHIKVVLTTNFDRLLEQAMMDLGMHPNVVSSPDAIEGAVPLIHSDHCIVKLHGDYRDTRILNTTAELEVYDNRVNALLDGVLADFGLVVCGWSGEWDVALREAVERCGARRYSAYWVAVGRVRDTANRLIRHRGAEVITSAGAEAFFPALADVVEAIQEAQSPHPASVAAAVALVKQYVAEDRHRIRLHDLVMDEAQSVFANVFGTEFPVDAAGQGTEELRRRVECFESATSTLRAMVSVGAYWGDEQHEDLWATSVLKLASRPQANGWIKAWRALQLYPALILLYSAAISAVARGRYGALAHLQRLSVGEEGQARPFFYLIHPWNIYAEINAWPDQSPRAHTPISDRLHTILREDFQTVIPIAERYDTAFDKAEYLFALMVSDARQQMNLDSWGAIGRFGWRVQVYHGLDSIPGIAELNAEVDGDGAQSQILASGLFGGSTDRFRQARDAVHELVKNLKWW